MTSTQRFAITVLVLTATVVLAVANKIDPTVSVGLFTTVLGYVLGDRNGEKRSATALADKGLNADSINAIVAAIKAKP